MTDNAGAVDFSKIDRGGQKSVKSEEKSGFFQARDYYNIGFLKSQVFFYKFFKFGVL